MFHLTAIPSGIFSHWVFRFNCIYFIVYFKHFTFLERDNNKNTIKNVRNYEKLKTKLTEILISQNFSEQIEQG